MKKFICLLISCAILASAMTMLVSCDDDKYPPVESTEQERTVVISVSIDGESYDIKYELYRALFLACKNEVDEGEPSVWVGENAAEYVNKINGIIIERACEIYSVLHHADSVGIDAYSDEVDELIEEYIDVSVIGGYYGSIYYEGYDGDYQKYLDSLSALGLNYATHILLLRYSIVYDMLCEYYSSVLDAEFLPEIFESHYEYTREAVYDYYMSDSCVRVIYLYLNDDYYTAARAEEIRTAIDSLSQKTEQSVAAKMINYSVNTYDDLYRGMHIGRYSLDDRYYGELTTLAFDLSECEISPVISVITGYENGHYILCGASKSDEMFDLYFDDISQSFAQDRLGRELYEIEQTLIESVSYSSAYFSIVHGNIE